MFGRLWLSWAAATGVLIAALGTAIGVGGGLPWGVAWVLAATVVTFAVYGFDKAAAAGGRRRVPELSLHLLAVGGGGFGALAGRRVFHHKTTKREFTVVITVGVLTTLAIVWIGT